MPLFLEVVTCAYAESADKKRKEKKADTRLQG